LRSPLSSFSPATATPPTPTYTLSLHDALPISYPALRGANQLLNASGVLAALEAVRNRLPVSAQAVRTGLATVELPGRFQIIPGQDRKSTRLNSSHVKISYAVFCLKKKKQKTRQ